MVLITILIMKDAVFIADSHVLHPYTVTAYSFLPISITPSRSTEFKAKDQETEAGALLNNLLQ